MKKHALTLGMLALLIGCGQDDPGSATATDDPGREPATVEPTDPRREPATVEPTDPSRDQARRAQEATVEPTDPSREPATVDPLCPTPAVCRGKPCFMGQRCDPDRGCTPRIVTTRSFSADTLSLVFDVTGQGGIALAGSYNKPASDPADPLDVQALVARLTPNGEMKWSRSFGEAGLAEQATKLRIDAERNLWVAGIFQGPILRHGGLEATGHGDDDVFVFKLMGEGKPLWLQALGGAGDDQVFDLDVGEEGNGYLLTGGDRGEHDSFTLTRIRPDGSKGWARQLPGTTPTLGLYQDDQFYLAATFTAPTVKVLWQEVGRREGDETGIWLARMDWDGDLVWALALDGDGAARRIQDIIAMKDGDLVIAGFGALDGFPATDGEGRMFAARLSPAGTPEQIWRFGPPPGSPGPTDVTLVLGRNDRVHLGGGFSGPFHWGGITPRPDLEEGRFTGTIETDGAFGEILMTDGSGAAYPPRMARDDAARVYLISDRADGEDEGFRLLTIAP